MDLKDKLVSSLLAFDDHLEEIPLFMNRNKAIQYF